MKIPQGLDFRKQNKDEGMKCSETLAETEPLLVPANSIIEAGSPFDREGVVHLIK